MINHRKSRPRPPAIPRTLREATQESLAFHYIPVKFLLRSGPRGRKAATAAERYPPAAFPAGLGARFLGRRL